MKLELPLCGDDGDILSFTADELNPRNMMVCPSIDEGITTLEKGSIDILCEHCDQVKNHAETEYHIALPYLVVRALVDAFLNPKCKVCGGKGELHDLLYLSEHDGERLYEEGDYIPDCVAKCGFCSYSSPVIEKSLVPDWLLKQENEDGILLVAIAALRSPEAIWEWLYSLEKSNE